jgi:hypothetical protein
MAEEFVAQSPFIPGIIEIAQKDEFGFVTPA